MSILYTLWAQYLIHYVFQIVDGSGRFKIRLISYEDFHGKDKDGKCCDGFLQNSTKLCKPCDHFIFSCLMNAHDHGKGYSKTSLMFVDVFYSC